MARVIAGSLAAGAVTALVLTLVVFPGATESVITGSVLLAFGLGWALIARPVRRDDQPAPALGRRPRRRHGRHRCSASLVFSPRDAALTALSWVWPPVMLALAVWMFVQMRRRLPGRGRWLLTPVVVVLAVASVGATYENVVAGPRPGHLPRPREDLRGGRPPAAPRLPAAPAAPRSCSSTASASSPPPGPGSPTRSAPPPGSAPTTAPDRAGATTSRAPRTA